MAIAEFILRVNGSAKRQLLSQRLSGFQYDVGYTILQKGAGKAAAPPRQKSGHMQPALTRSTQTGCPASTKSVRSQRSESPDGARDTSSCHQNYATNQN
jgi:hypothetical protein